MYEATAFSLHAPSMAWGRLVRQPTTRRPLELTASWRLNQASTRAGGQGGQAGKWVSRQAGGQVGRQAGHGALVCLSAAWV